jgi:hypothetical protein
MRMTQSLSQFQDLVVPKLDDSITRRAVKMIVRRRSIIVLEGAAVGQAKLTDQPRLNQQS